jgi:hypothetical protein
MSDEPTKAALTRRERMGCLITFVVATCVVGVPLFLFVQHERQVLTNFDSLWGTTWAIEHYVADRHEWPSDWDRLLPYFATLNPPATDDDLLQARKRIEVNFQLDFRKTPLPSDWYVRVKQHTNSAQEEEAHYYLRRHIAKLQTDLGGKPLK